MPYVKLWEPRGVVKRFSGFVTGDEFAASVRAIASDPRFDGLRYIISHFLDIDGHGVDARALREAAISRLGSVHTNPNIRVMVVTADPAVAAFKTGIEVHAPVYDTRIFTTEAEARDWFAAQPPMHDLPPGYRGLGN